MKKQGYKDLEIYQLAHRLAVEVHQVTLNALPKFELYEEGSQLRRSAKSIPSNIVEGFGRRRYQSEYVRYLTYAMASCDETREHLELLVGSGSLQKSEKVCYLLEQYSILGRMIRRFRDAVLTSLAAEASPVYVPGGVQEPVASS